MSDLLIHSMSEFSSLILPCLEEMKARDIVEIGSEFGGMSRVLGQWAQEHNGSLTCIDPEPAKGFADWVSSAPHLRHVAQPSLEMGRLAMELLLREIQASKDDEEPAYETIVLKTELKVRDSSQRITEKAH